MRSRKLKGMKRFVSILLSFLIILIGAVSIAEETPWVTVENVRDQSGYVWREEISGYNGAEERDFQPIVMDPAEAYQRLREAYDRGGDEGTRELLRSWGIEMETCGAPVLRELIGFSGWGWGEEGTLIFVEQWPDWQLWDYIPYACEDFRLCGTDHGTSVYLEFSVIGHGTGCHVRYIDVFAVRGDGNRRMPDLDAAEVGVDLPEDRLKDVWIPTVTKQ